MHYYGEQPRYIDRFGVTFTELMRYLYLPVKMADSDEIRLEPRLEFLRQMVEAVGWYESVNDQYVYLTAVHGYATPGNPLNRPGWHCDGFGTDDINYIWWHGPGTQFARQTFEGIDSGHVLSMRQFEEQVRPDAIWTPADRTLYRLNPYVVHAAPEIVEGGWRSFVKISVSPHQYNLRGNSHNYEFDYDWKMWPREVARNHPVYGEADFYLEDA